MSYRHAVPPGSTVGLAGGGGTRPSQVVASRTPNLAILLTLCGQLIPSEKLVNLMPRDVRF